MKIIHEIEKDINKESNKKHILIKGDNLDSLNYLLINYKNKINTIYIDPPYNSWKYIGYKNKFGTISDKHSVWINFMEERLSLAKELLSDDGLIFISIDDYELANLKLLCDKIFGENNFIANSVVISNPNGKDDEKIISYVHEYILVYSKNKIIPKKPGIKSVFLNPKFYYRKGTEELQNIFSDMDENEFHFNYPKPVELIKEILKINTEKNSIVLDFFAGSGTTGQAVMELNAENNTNIKCILCQWDENNICDNITYRRLKVVTTGKRYDNTSYGNGFECGWEYYNIKKED